MHMYDLAVLGNPVTHATAIFRMDATPRWWMRFALWGQVCCSMVR